MPLLPPSRLLKRPSGEFGNQADGFEAYGDDLADEADDVFGVVFAVGVVDDAAALVGADLVLVDDPFEGAAVAEAIFVGLRWDSAQG